MAPGRLPSGQAMTPAEKPGGIVCLLARAGDRQENKQQGRPQAEAEEGMLGHRMQIGGELERVGASSGQTGLTAFDVPPKRLPGQKGKAVVGVSQRLATVARQSRGLGDRPLGPASGVPMLWGSTHQPSRVLPPRTASAVSQAEDSF